MGRRSRANGRPAVQVFGSVRARVVRGPNGDRWYWRAERYRDGATHHLWTGWATVDELPDVLAAVDAANPHQPAARTPTVLVTVRDLMETWYGAQRARQDIKDKTKEVDRYFADALVDGLGAVPLRMLGLADVEHYRDNRLIEGISTQTLEHEVRKLGQAWRWARRRRLGPDRDLELPRIRVLPTRPKRTPTLDETRRILAQMDPTTWPYIAMLVIAHTGLRVGEVADLLWRDLDLDGPDPLLHVPDNGKTGWRAVPLTPTLAQRLRAWRGRAASDRRVLGVSGGTARTSLSQRYLPAACAAAECPTFTPHSFRRMAVDSMYDTCAEPSTAGSVAGHSPYTAMRKYRTVSLARRREAMKAAGLDFLGDNVIALGDQGEPPEGPAEGDETAPTTELGA